MLSFTSEPATVGEASRPLAAPFWAGSAQRTPTKSDADAEADADLTFVEGEDREKHAAPPPPSPLNAVLAFGGWRTVRPEPRRLVRMPAPPRKYYGRRRCVLAAALAFVLCGAAPARPPPPSPPPKKEFPWVPVAVAGAGAIALARPEVRAGRALASLGRGVVIGAFPA